jgi:glycosyltransferase involved in cell wall biosynthesis
MVYERYALWSHAAMRWARSHGVRSLLEVNAPLVDEQEKHRGLADRLGAEIFTDMAFDSADKLIAVSHGVADWLLASGVSADRIQVIGNGVDVGRFKPAERTGSDPFTVGFVGTLKPWHGLPALVEAARLVREAGVPLRLLIVGDGPERDPISVELAAAGLDACTEFTGAVPSERIPALIQRMDVALAPYPALPDFYFSPLKIAEYMATGVAVVASRIGDIGRLITHDQDGLLCPPGDAKAFASAILRLHRDPGLRERLGTAARVKAERELGWDAAVARILDLTPEMAPC